MKIDQNGSCLVNRCEVFIKKFGSFSIYGLQQSRPIWLKLHKKKEARESSSFYLFLSFRGTLSCLCTISINSLTTSLCWLLPSLREKNHISSYITYSPPMQMKTLCLFIYPALYLNKMAAACLANAPFS
jgi:hypothetical protein